MPQDNGVSREERKTKYIMVQGTMSGAGKSLLVAGLCRIFKQDGYRVAPFKSQNMALNSFVTEDGLEMGRAQVMQAEAAGVRPDVHMNPILLKPTDDKGSQVIINGKVHGNMRAKEYFAYKTSLIPTIREALDYLEERYDIIVVEGAGSPAEINLKQNDIVNMGIAKMTNAPVLLVGDIDRGGVFAQLLGTIMLLEEDEKRLVKGLVVNKFRGDKTILDPGIAMLEEQGNIPVVGLLPYMDVQLEDEDSLSERFESRKQGLINIAVIKLPHISNFTDYDVFEQLPEVAVCYVKKSRDLENADLVIIPGSKNTIADMKWLRENGFAAVLQKLEQDGKPIFGICGGYQMLGVTIEDPDGVEGGGCVEGLGLLEHTTILQGEKCRRQVEGKLPVIGGCFGGLSGQNYYGYEIHMGKSNDQGKVINQKNNVYGTYVHGFFDSEEIARGIVDTLAKEKKVTIHTEDLMDYQTFKQQEYEKLASLMRESLDMNQIYEMMGIRR
ncbi:MAG: cobyric acid synthase [Lachnospiraceae bacterium]|nr:cobyric acid synthase [Lachnospiraceae bacterium]